MKDKDVLCHNGASRTDGKPAEGLLRGQGSPLIPGPRFIWTHPYAQQLPDRTENWKQYGTVNCRV